MRRGPIGQLIPMTCCAKTVYSPFMAPIKKVKLPIAGEICIYFTATASDDICVILNNCRV